MKNRVIDPETLKTDWDHDDEYARSQYEKGISIGRNAKVVFIGSNNVWSCRNQDGSFTGSYEKLGFHRSTRELYLGFIASGVPILVYS